MKWNYLLRRVCGGNLNKPRQINVVSLIIVFGTVLLEKTGRASRQKRAVSVLRQIYT